MTTDVELDRMYEAAISDEWEEQNREDPKREALRIAADKTVGLIEEAWKTLGGAVDEDSKFLDLVCSYCNDMEDLIDNLKAERW